MKYLIFIFYFLNVFFSFSQEVCDNGIDDDNDGLTDYNDTLDCSCYGLDIVKDIPSLIPNYSFEEHTCCGGISQLNCANSWTQASGATSDYWNTCGSGSFASGPSFPLPGGGSGYVGFFNLPGNPGWQEHIGTCLPSPLIAGTSYSLSFWMAGGGGPYNMSLSIYGTPNCNDLPWNGNGCPIGLGNWLVLETAYISLPTNDDWTNVTFSFTPTQDIFAIDFGGSCNSGTGGYFYLDELLLAKTTDFSNISLLETGSFCKDSKELNAQIDTTGGTWQWYYNDIALVGETNATLDLSNNGLLAGNYSVIYTLSSSCEKKDIIVSLPKFPLADFRSDIVCEANSTSFTDLSISNTTSIVDWNWDFTSDAIIDDTLQNPTYIYSLSGSFNAYLSITNDEGCSHDTAKLVIVNPNPDVDFSGGDVCEGNVINFMDQSTIAFGNNVSWSWNFGDGIGSSLAQDTSYLYAISNTYNVTLVVVSDSLCSSNRTQTVNVWNNPIANFMLIDSCVNLAVAFTDNSTISTGNINNWQWSFGDNTPLNNLQNPNYIYGAPGIYQSTLIVTSNQGCTDTLSKPVEVFPLPNADFTFTTGCLYDSVLFEDQSTVPTPQTITNWHWDFGDGTPREYTNNVNHLYSSAMNYTITHIVSSNNNCSDTAQQVITINPIPEANFINTPVCENTPPVIFIDYSSISSGSITSWNWNFGDGNTSTQTSPYNTYTTAGTYQTQLIVTSDHNCIDTVFLPTIVHPVPIADFTQDTTKGCNPVCVNFSDLSISNASNITSWQWIYGNGFISTDQNPFTCFENISNTNDEQFTVTLTAQNDLGCIDTITKNNLITVWHYPIADFTISPEETNMYEAEIETFNASIGADNYSWDFGNNTYTSEYEPIILYSDTGNFLITLIASTINNCTDTAYQQVLVNPVASIYVPNTFTPNGDGNNDTFIYKGFGILEESAIFRIFDRWGLLIYETNNIPWDGKYKGEKVQIDTYVYKLACTDVLGKKYNIIGHVNLIK